jgi:sugar lactone lactonase YvrE
MRKEAMFKTARMLGLAMTLAMVSIHPPSWADAGEIDLYVANQDNGTIRQFSQTGTDLGNFQSGLSSPTWISVDRSGDLFVSNYTGNIGSVQEYSTQGNLLMTISTPFQPGDALVTSSGTILVGDYFGGSVYQYSSTGQSLGLFCNLGIRRAAWMAFDSQGNLYVTDFQSGVVRKISSTGVDEGNFLANVQGVNGIAFDSHGDLYAAFSNDTSYYNGPNMIREYSASGQDLGLIASTGLNLPYGITFGPDGNLYVTYHTYGGNDTIHEFSPTGTDLGVFASTGLDDPKSLVFDAASVPEPSSAVLLIMAGVTVPTCLLLHRHWASGRKARTSR